MARPRVFISHSAKEPDARAALTELVDASRVSGFEPVVDYERLRIGELWWEALSLELRTAHAVVVLISPSALDSTRVLQEVTLALDNRLDARGNVRVFVLRVPDVSYQAIERSPLGAVGLHDIQSQIVRDTATLRSIVPGMLRAILAAYADRPHEALEAALETCLAELQPHALQLAAESLGLEVRLHSPLVLGARIAQELLEYSDHPVIGARKVQRFLEGVLVPISRHRAETVLDIAFACAVLPDEVRGQLQRVLEGRPYGAAAVVTVEKAETGYLYVRRACCTPHAWNTHNTTGLGADRHLDELLADVRAYVIESLGFDADDNPNDRELDDELTAFEESAGPVVVILKAVPDQQLLRHLVSRMPRVLFLFVSGSIRPTQTNGLHWLTPALDPQQENVVLRVRHQIRSRLIR